MLELRGKYNTAKVFTDNIDEETIAQIINLCNQDFSQGSQIRIMPDCHAGMGCVIGFTADLGEKIIPNIVGVDIGCGMTTIELGKINVNLKRLDKIINKNIPSGRNTHAGQVLKFPKIETLHCYRELKNTKRMERSIGTLGGGNHFIELNKDDEDNLYLVIHSGSRNLGKQVADYYQKIAIKQCRAQGLDYPRDLCFLEGTWRERYLHDMQVCQEYATINRETMANIILDHLWGASLADFEHFQTIHNYINFKDNIVRKGSISAYKGEKVLIPINMRDGSILAIGKGNPDWNYSAPHGAGRIMSRSKAKEKITMTEYAKAMEGIYTTSVNKSTLDEAPMAYKPIEEIINNIQDTVEIVKIITPVYNFKAGE
ncbi:MAG: RtcB family protein [Clostridia bacterium]|nr:RtcB family protein [Clostridia bacterium]